MGSLMEIVKKILISFGGSLLFNFKMMNVNAGPGGKVVYTREQTSKFFFPKNLIFLFIFHLCNLDIVIVIIIKIKPKVAF